MKRFIQTDFGGSLITAIVVGPIFGLGALAVEQSWETFIRMAAIGAIFVFLVSWLNDKFYVWLGNTVSDKKKSDSEK